MKKYVNDPDTPQTDSHPGVPRFIYDDLKKSYDEMLEVLGAVMTFFNTIDLPNEDFIIGYEGNPETDFNVKDLVRKTLCEAKEIKWWFILTMEPEKWVIPQELIES
jgi:hypothetical protein